MLEVSRLGSREQPQLVLSGVCDVLGVRCHTASASLAAGPRRRDSAGEHKATLGGDSGAGQPHTGVTPQRGHPERGCCGHRGQGRLSLLSGSPQGCQKALLAQPRLSRGRRAQVRVTLCWQEPHMWWPGSALTTERWPWRRSPGWGGWLGSAFGVAVGWEGSAG